MGKTRFNEPVIAPGFELFSGGSIGSGGPWVFDVTDPDYGAQGDGTTDDTDAIQAAIDAAFAYAVANETAYAEVYIPPSPTPYLLSGALTQGGATKGNSQLTIPVRAGTARKVTLVVRGGSDGAAMPYWQQTVGQRWGVTLKSTLAGQSVSAAWGAPGVLGGPAISGSSSEFGASGAVFDNVCVVLAGIGISLPAEPTLGGVNFRGLAQARILDCAVMADATPTTLNDNKPPNNDWTFGFMLPDPFNNDLSVINNASVYGLNDAFVIGEHSWVDRAAAIYCGNGFNFLCVSENNHSVACGALSCEASTNAITTIGTDSYGFPIHIAALSCETISGFHVSDVHNCLSGQLHLTALGGPDDIEVSGGSHLEIIAANQDRGVATAPALAATTVAVPNPFWRHAAVSVVGGTVTAIKVDATTVLATTPGTVIVPSGHSITLDYSDATGLSWKWVLL